MLTPGTQAQPCLQLIRNFAQSFKLVSGNRCAPFGLASPLSRYTRTGVFSLGVGPLFLLPTATDELLGAGKWGTGPTGVVVWQSSGWTVGILAWHNWSFAGDADRADVDETFVQPVIAHTTSRAWTFTLQVPTPVPMASAAV